MIGIENHLDKKPGIAPAIRRAGYGIDRWRLSNFIPTPLLKFELIYVNLASLNNDGFIN
jgi:hypothetical protein